MLVLKITHVIKLRNGLLFELPIRKEDKKALLSCIKLNYSVIDIRCILFVLLMGLLRNQGC